MSIQERFWSKTKPVGECIEWNSHKDWSGYGKFFIGGKLAMAHRVAYELVRGPIPAGLCIDHLCRNHSCVNVAHLEAVTLRENILRGINPAARNLRKTHCVRGHEFTQENTTLAKYRRERICKECKRASSRLYHAKYRERHNAANMACYWKRKARARAAV